MIKKVRARARDIKICVGGLCCVPKAVRRKLKTIINLVKLVITKIRLGARMRSVSTRTTLRVVTSWRGELGAVSERLTVGMLWAARASANPKKAKSTKILPSFT